MSSQSSLNGFVTDCKKWPEHFPTHLHSCDFWESLGRTVATFGFLEETLGKAIFAFTGMREVPADEVEVELSKWSSTLERALSGTLERLISLYETAVKESAHGAVPNFDDLIKALREAKIIRNVICHASWRAPDEQGKSLPPFVSNQMDIFNTTVDREYLDQVRAHVVELIAAVINSVTLMGWQFPGSNGPGKVLWAKR